MTVRFLSDKNIEADIVSGLDEFIRSESSESRGMIVALWHNQFDV